MNAAIEVILRRKSIMEYLEAKGVQPSKSLSGGKYSFYCPLPDHQDKNSPSFIVWTNEDYENFHCFGCQRGYTIIHLLSYMENIPFRDALRRLSEDLDISIEENINFTIESLNKILSDVTSNPLSIHFDISQKLLSISSLCRGYLESVIFDDDECGIMDRFWREVDKEILDFDFHGVDETLQHLPQILRLRRELYEDLSIEKQRQQYASQENHKTSV